MGDEGERAERIAFRFTEGERKVFQRKPPMPVSEWASQNIIVQDGPYRGAKYRPDVTPYLIDIMDVFSWDTVEEVVVCGAPQTGKTLAMYACLGYSMDRRPGTKMLAMPDDKVLARVEAEKLKPLLKSSPGLNGLVARMTAGHIRLKDGSSIYLSSAMAPAQRASITVRDLFLDEEDLYGTVTGRGDPVSDFLERTRSYFFGRKIMRVSKPVGDSHSSIWNALTLGADICFSYEVKCPRCGEPQFFREPNLVLAGNADPEKYEATVIERLSLGRYKCFHCEQLWDDAEKNRAVAGGAWRPSRVRELGDSGIPVFETAERPSYVKKVGFHLPAILSQAVSLSNLAARRKRADESEDMEVKQTQANGDWARPYITVTVKPLEADILSRRDFSLEARTVPHGAIALTCGIDTQKTGFYYLVLAWMPNLSKYVIDYGRLATFEDVTTLVYETPYPCLDADGKKDGSYMEVWRAGIDSGGTAGEGVYTRTEEVYEYVRLEGYDRLFAIKGSSNDQTPTIKWTTLDKLPGRQTPIPGGLMLYIIDTAKIKSSMFAALLSPDAKRPLRLYGREPEAEGKDRVVTHDELISHLTAERQIRNPRGQLVWVQDKKANHYLDCMMIASACGDVTWTPSLHHLATELKEEAEAAAKQAYIPPYKPAKKAKRRFNRAW
jgi:phage terminase large subunit GpA-like protein